MSHSNPIRPISTSPPFGSAAFTQTASSSPLGRPAALGSFAVNLPPPTKQVTSPIAMALAGNMQAVERRLNLHKKHLTKASAYRDYNPLVEAPQRKDNAHSSRDGKSQAEDELARQCAKRMSAHSRVEKAKKKEFRISKLSREERQARRALKHNKEYPGEDHNACA